jgi:hypothetical protein
MKLINEQFIPVKLDGNKQEELVRYLRITAYPTTLLTDPDGKILDIIEGYKEAKPFRVYLLWVLAKVEKPEWMVRDYQKALKACRAADYPRAITLLKGILADGRQRPVQQKSQQLLHVIEDKAARKRARDKEPVNKDDTSEDAPDGR